MNKVIQFIHPGVEHTISTGINWNSGAHRRKYLKIKGDYLTDLNSSSQNDTLFFWGEWEAQSEATAIENDKPDYPKTIFTPYYKYPAGRDNTDPFVFGNNFYYCVCKQGHYPSLRDVNKGDIILFGSCKNEHFVLDTLFVVKDIREYELSEIPLLKTKYNKAFYDVSLAPIYVTDCVPQKEIINTKGVCLPISCDDEDDKKPSKEVKKYRIYEAAMYDDRDEFSGMFSFVPCMPLKDGENGFKRPFITDDIYITNPLSQGIKISDIEDCYTFWNQITNQVLKQGLSLLINTDLPTLM